MTIVFFIELRVLKERNSTKVEKRIWVAGSHHIKCDVYRGREIFDSRFCTIIRNPF